MAMQFGSTATGFKYVDIPHQSYMNVSTAFTIMAWVKLTENNPVGTWLEFFTKANYYYIQTGYGSNNLGGGFYTGSTWRTLYSTVPASLNVWYHLVVSYDSTAGSNNLRVYVDGIIVNQTTYTDTVASTSSNFSIGALNSTRFHRGFEDDCRVYNRQLSDAEILTIYNLRGKDNITEGLIMRFVLDEGYPGQTASGSGINKDITININHGTPVNNPTWAESAL